jgi:hypothetical protein
MDKNSRPELKTPRTCHCGHEMPQGIRTVVDTDQGPAEVCPIGHSVDRE